MESSSRELASAGRLDLLEELLGDEAAWVRCNAAGWLLASNPDPAVATLEQRVADGGLVGFTAKMNLQEWRAGNLRGG